MTTSNGVQHVMVQFSEYENICTHHRAWLVGHRNAPDSGRSKRTQGADAASLHAITVQVFRNVACERIVAWMSALIAAWEAPPCSRVSSDAKEVLMCRRRHRLAAGTACLCHTARPKPELCTPGVSVANASSWEE